MKHPKADNDCGMKYTRCETDPSFTPSASGYSQTPSIPVEGAGQANNTDDGQGGVLKHGG